MDGEQFYPDWVYRDINEDRLPWKCSTGISIEDFFIKYTLHDSAWVGAFNDFGLNPSVILGFQWDSVWLPGSVMEGSSHVDDWPYLFMKLEKVHEISTANFTDIGDIGRSIGGAEVLKMDDRYHVAIDDVFGGQVTIVFSGEHTILAMCPERNLLKI